MKPPPSYKLILIPQLTPCSICVLRIKVCHLVTKLPTYHGMSSFITVLTTALHQSTPSYPIPVRSIIRLSSYICLGISCGLIPSGLLPKPCCLSLLLYACHMPCQPHLPPFNFPHNSEYKPWSSSSFKFLQPPDNSSLLGTITFLSSLFSNYEGHFRSFVFDFIVITKYKITIPLIFLNVYTHVVYSM